MRIVISRTDMRGIVGKRALPAVLGLAGGLFLFSCGSRGIEDASMDLGTDIAYAQKARRSGEFGEAIRRLETALPAEESEAAGIEEMNARLELGLLYWDTGQMEKSRSSYERAAVITGGGRLEEGARLADLFIRIHTGYAEGKRLRSEGKYEESARVFEEMIEIARSIGSRDHELKCLRQLSLVYWETGDFKTYRSLSERGLALARELNHRREEGLLLNNIGLYHWRSQDFLKAMRFYQDALRIADQIGDQETKLSATSNIAVIYSDLGEKSKAIRYMIEVSKIDEAQGNLYGLAIDLDNLGSFFYQIDNIFIKDRFEIALQYCLRALELSRKIPNRNLEQIILFNLGEITLANHDINGALLYYDAARSLADGFRDKWILSHIYCGIGNYYLKEEQLSFAHQQFEKSLHYALDDDVAGASWESYYGLGRCYEMEDELLKAAEQYSLAVECIEESRPNLSFDTVGSGFMGRKLPVFDRLINLLGKLRKMKSSQEADDIIFGYMEKAKARTFLDHLADSRIDLWKDTRPSQREGIDVISRRIESLTAEMTKKVQDGEDIAELRADLAAEEDRYLMTIASVESENAAGRDIALSKPLPARLIREQMDERTAILEYFLGETSSTAMILTKQGAEVLSLPPRGEIESSIKGYIAGVASPASVGPALAAAARRIFGDLGLETLAGMRPEIDALVVVPDGMLHYLPFEALVFPAGRDEGKYLVERFRVSYAPSAAVLYWLKARSKANGEASGILGFGDPVSRFHALKSRAGSEANDLFFGTRSRTRRAISRPRQERSI
jgi:tetratricopeptide (TPR) repeat protein